MFAKLRHCLTSIVVRISVEQASEATATVAAAPSETTTTAASRLIEEVDATHPEVVALVEVAVKAAEQQEVSLVPDVWIEVMEAAIEETEKAMRDTNPDGPMSVHFLAFPSNQMWKLYKMGSN